MDLRISQALASEQLSLSAGSKVQLYAIVACIQMAWNWFGGPGNDLSIRRTIVLCTVRNVGSSNPFWLPQFHTLFHMIGQFHWQSILR